MKKILMVVTLIAILGSLATIPLLSHASASDCVQPTPKPTVPSGSEVNQDNPATGGKIWVHSGRMEAGTVGPSGWVVVDGTNGRVYGRSSDPNAPLNGSVSGNGVCLSVAGNKITAP